VRLLYRIDAAEADPMLRSLSCGFAAERSGALQPRHLERVETEHGALGPVRLHLLKRHWLEAIGTVAADPAPIANADRVPHIPRRAATLLQSLIAALPQMAVYGLLASAYALIYGLIGRINLAFGDLATVASYGALIGLVGTGGVNALSASLAGALVLALWASGMHGALAGRLVFAPIAARRGQVVLIASTGLALFLAEYVRLAQGSGMRWTPPLFNAPVGLARAGEFVVTTTPMAVAVTAIALLAAGGVIMLVHRSRFGRAWRACADDPRAAELMGLNSASVLLRTFLLASLVAGLGGAVTTLYYGGVTYSSGLIVGLKALIAAILGGIGSVQGAFLGGLLLGAVEALWSALFPIELRDPVVFGLLAVVLALRPGGLKGTPELDPRRD
jgi:branched-subunit amino acid ABC-type transport system permease component